MNTKPIMPPKFMGKAAKIMAEIRTQACADIIDTEVLEDILRAALNEYYDEGYGDGYDDGYSDGHFKKHSAV